MAALSKARELSKISLKDHPELREPAAEIMKTVKATRRKIETLQHAAEHNGKLDQGSMNSALDRILKAAEEVSREVDTLLSKARK